MVDREPAPVGITVYGCEPAEAALFNALSPGFGIIPTMTSVAKVHRRMPKLFDLPEKASDSGTARDVASGTAPFAGPDGPAAAVT